jgi:hypothetical protein
MDIYLFEFTNSVFAFDHKNEIDPLYPNLKLHNTRIANLEPIKAYLESDRNEKLYSASKKYCDIPKSLRHYKK